MEKGQKVFYEVPLSNYFCKWSAIFFHKDHYMIIHIKQDNSKDQERTEILW